MAQRIDPEDRAGPRGPRVGSRAVFSYLELDKNGRAVFGKWTRMTQLKLKLLGEPFRWGVQPGCLQDFLASVDFEVMDAPGIDVLRDRYLTQTPLAEAPLCPYEHLAVAVAG